MSSLYHYIYYYITNHLDFELLTARVVGFFTYCMTYLFDFKNFLAVFSTNINFADEILIGLVRLVSAVLSALAILFFTDVYKYVKKKIIKEKTEES